MVVSMRNSAIRIAPTAMLSVAAVRVMDRLRLCLAEVALKGSDRNMDKAAIASMVPMLKTMM